MQTAPGGLVSERPRRSEPGLLLADAGVFAGQLVVKGLTALEVSLYTAEGFLVVRGKGQHPLLHSLLVPVLVALAAVNLILFLFKLFDQKAISRELF
jgi:Zn-dependent protease